VSDPKVTAAHLRRAAAVYCRQSTLIQVERNRESTLRQYDLVSRAAALGWPRPAVRVIDADLGVTGSGALLDDVVVTVDGQARTARLVLHWKGGLLSETSADLPRPKPPYRTSEDTISLIGRLAVHYDDGYVPGEQITPGAPWRIRLTDSIRALVADDDPAGWVPVQVATAALGVSRQTVLQRVKRGDLRAVHIRAGRRKGLRIELPAPQDGLF